MLSQICHVFMKQEVTWSFLSCGREQRRWFVSLAVAEQRGPCCFASITLEKLMNTNTSRKTGFFCFKRTLPHALSRPFLWALWRFSVHALWSPESSSFPSFTADNTILYFCLDRTLVLINSTELFSVPLISTYLFFFWLFRAILLLHRTPSA